MLVLYFASSSLESLYFFDIPPIFSVSGGLNATYQHFDLVRFYPMMASYSFYDFYVKIFLEG